MNWSARQKELEAQDAAEIDSALRSLGHNPPIFMGTLKEFGLTVAKIRDVSTYGRHSQIMDGERKAEDQQAREAAKAAAIPYSGAIKRCQADVFSNDRLASFYRCFKKGTLVVRREERKGEGDGRLVVCGTHARDTSSHRHMGSGGFRGNESAATEVVESEYQP